MLVLLLGPVSWRLPGVRTPISLYTSQACVGHEPGGSHPERPARLEQLLRALKGKWVYEFGESLQVCEPAVDVTEAQVLRVHTRGHVAKVNSAFAASQLLRRVKLDSDTVASPGTGAAARRAAGLVVAAVDDVLGDHEDTREARPRRAFVMARPPGHHADAGQAQGFCFYNNVLIGVAHAEAAHGLSRVAILDFDVHHGNGDADIAEDEPSRLYVSSHEVPNYPGTGEARGRSGAHRNIVSAPLPPNATSAAFRRVWRAALLPAVRAFRPEALFLSAGFDAHRDDPLSSTRLSDDDFKWLTQQVVAIGGGRLPIISVLEGGYNVEALEGSVRTHLEALIRG